MITRRSFVHAAFATSTLPFSWPARTFAASPARRLFVDQACANAHDLRDCGPLQWMPNDADHALTRLIADVESHAVVTVVGFSRAPHYFLASQKLFEHGFATVFRGMHLYNSASLTLHHELMGDRRSSASLRCALAAAGCGWRRVLLAALPRVSADALATTVTLELPRLADDGHATQTVSWVLQRGARHRAG